MTYTFHEREQTTRASAVHLLALTGPIIPAALFFASRRTDRFAAGEAAKATNFAAAAVIAFVLATLVRIFVPLVGFVGTLSQWVVPVVAVYCCLAGFRLARRGEPAQYPIQFKVVKTDD